MSKLLSICIPSFNMEEYLSRCVDSMLVDEILDQLEIIIVNDGSKDGTLAIACFPHPENEKHLETLDFIGFAGFKMLQHIWYLAANRRWEAVF